MERKNSISSVNGSNGQIFAGQPLPIIIQEFFWKQTGPFIRPKFGKHHEASCMFCQNAHIHNDMKEACKVLEKVLVQNIPINTVNPVYKAIQKVPRWRLIEAAFPHIVHCVASFLQYRKDVMDLQTVSQTESKLLYILHWIILDAAEECADADFENGVNQHLPYYYLFPITSITLFIYMLAPVLHRIKESELQSYRLENGIKLWRALWEYRHPDAPCFTTYCKLHPNRVWCRKIREHHASFDILPGRKISKDEEQINASPVGGPTSCAYFDTQSCNKSSSSEKVTAMPFSKSSAKTLVQEYSNGSGEHTVILRLPSLVESEDVTKDSPVIFSGKASILQLAMGRSACTMGRASLPSEHLQLPPDIMQHMAARHSITNTGVTINKEVIFDTSKTLKPTTPETVTKPVNLYAATFMDVAVLRCLFVSQWPEEGVFWALNFLYRRLQTMNKIKLEQQPRKRSNSLPIPKIEVTFHDSPESKRKYTYGNRDMPSGGDHKHSLTGASGDEPTLRSQKCMDKAKKKAKIADLKTFVEGKLLSRSEKNLEKIAQMEENGFYDSEYRYSLDSDPDDGKTSTHPTTSLAKIISLEEGDSSKLGGLVKVTSMPSLRIGEDKCGNMDKHSMNPVITVTQHTPNPSPDYLRRKQHSFESYPGNGMGCGGAGGGGVGGSGEQEDSRVSRDSKQPSLTRSLTDSNISYSGEEFSEAAGSSGYVNKDGDIDILVVLQAMHSISQREKIVCSAQVCDIVIKILELLVDMGILHQHFREEHRCKNEYLFSLDFFASFLKCQKIIDPLTLFASTVFRIIKHLGCPNHCNESQKISTASSTDVLRSQCQLLLSRLRKINLEQFEKYLQTFIQSSSIADVLEFFHAFCGFCVDPCSLLSPNQKRTIKSPDGSFQGGYSTNFGAGLNNIYGGRGIEGQILMATFKIFVSRLTATPKEIKAPENMSLYHDARLLINYIKEVHGGIFRQVLLSGLIDTEVKTHRKEVNVQTTKVIRHIPQCDQEVQMDNSIFVVDDRERKALIKKRSTSSACASLHETDDIDEGKFSQSPCNYVRKKHPVLTPRHSERYFQRPDLVKTQSRFPISGLVNWLRKEYARTDSLDSHFQDDNDMSLDAVLSQQISALQHSHAKSTPKSFTSVGQTFFKAKKRVGDQLNKIGFKKGKKKSRSVEDTQGSYLSRRNSIETGNQSRDSEFLVLKERKLISTGALYSGMQRLAFMLEICHPGSVPDPSLVAAVLDLPHTPVIARAAFLLECSYYVHCFNKGQWPLWTKLNLPGFRQSGPLSCTRGSTAPNGLRRAQMLQRSAGKMFHLWAEAIASRLDEMLNKDEENIPDVITLMGDENKHGDLLADDEEEDFLDEATDLQTGSSCPMPLRLLACMLLFEITAYLRETFQNLPKSIRVVGRERATMWEKSYMKDANRRFSIALSSMGHSQASAQSLQSISCDREPKNEKIEEPRSKCDLQKQSSLKNSKINEKRASQALNAFRKYAKHVMTAGERKISFVLHEPEGDNEDGSGGASNAAGGAIALTNQTGDDKTETATDDKKSKKSGSSTSATASSGRPYLLRRSTASGAGGSIKRRSFRFKKSSNKDSNKENADGKKLVAKESSTETKKNDSVRRVDSIQSKRQKGSLSDRSDTSELCPSAGEESPGIMESPDEQVPESPTDSNDVDDSSANMPWIKVVVRMMNSLNYYCSHQNFCHPFCYRRHMRACSRLTKALRKVYGEEFGALQADNFFEKFSSKDHKNHKLLDRSGSQTSPIKRRDSFSKCGPGAGIHSSTDSYVREVGTVEDCSNSDKGSKQRTSKKNESEKKMKDQSMMLRYIKTQVKDSFHSPMAILIKSIVILSEEHVIDILPIAWELLLESNQEVVATAASLFIVAAFKAPTKANEIMLKGLQNVETAVRINAILRFQVLWRHRYQAWPRMEERAQTTFRLPPPSIEFTLTSPKIGIESLPVVDPPWMTINAEIPVNKFPKAEESHRQLSARKTTEKREVPPPPLTYHAMKQKTTDGRESFLITAIPIAIQAGYEPSVPHAVGDVDHDEADDESCDTQETNKPQLQQQSQQSQQQQQPLSQQKSSNIHGQSLAVLFPSCLCSAVVEIISLLDDAAVSADGNSVYEVAYQVIWNCLVEDSSLFLRYILERVTRDKQELMFKILRHLIRFIPKLPQQAAFALYNYIIGYVMFYVRSPHENGQKMIGAALSILWMVVHSVHGIMFKDLKQILRKEQCDMAILLTAHAPSAKKIIVHGPQEQDGGGIPSQFPVQEDTQFCQLWRESLDYFNIEEKDYKEYFLVDHKTHQIHNVNSYVRDYYCFKRSQYPQLELVHMKPEDAFNALQRQELLHKFIEIGKVLLTWAILKNVDMVMQRVVFLHEELIKIGSFPRKALEADLDLYKNGEMGKELLGLDVLHKFMWVRLIARMFEAMAGNFAYSSDIHLSMNVLNGALMLHGEDACILRYVMATYINAAYNFKNIFSTNGYFLIMPTLLQVYSSHNTNSLVTRTIEYTVKQFYLMNRKPFILQMFGSVSTILDIDDSSQYGRAHEVESSCLFQLLLSLETPSPDPLNIGELVKEEKPLKAIDFCYHDENEMINVVDCISLCVMVVSYAADSLRAYQMLVILEAILPCYLRQIQSSEYRKNGKSEREIIAQLAISIKTLVNKCEALTKNYNGPQKTTPEHKTSSQRNYSKGPYSPAYDYDDDSKYIIDRGRSKMTYDRDADDSEQLLRTDFRRPRDVLLSTVADFVTKSSCRLIELYKKCPLDGKHVELLDLRSYVRLADIAITLLKVSPYDPETMACKGLQRYMSHLLPATDWSNETIRQTLLSMLRRVDKMFVKIYKKASIRRQVDWAAASGILKGVYETLSRYPSLVFHQPMKALINTCQALITADTASLGIGENLSSASVAVMSKVPPPQFISIVIKLIALQILAFGEIYSLEHVCGSSISSPLPEKVENIFVNFLLPFCLRVGGGARDEVCIRQNDITFALTAVLNLMSPSTSRSFASGSQNLKTMSEIRTASMTYNSRDTKIVSGLSPFIYKVAFLGLKIMQVCFESELNAHWQKTARTIKEVSKVTEARLSFWNYLEFLVSNRNPLFIILLPFLHQRVIQPSVNEIERQAQLRVREKLISFNPSPPMCRSSLVFQLKNELRDLKMEIENKKIELDTKTKDSYGGSLDVPNQRTSFSDYLDTHNAQCENLIHRGSITSTQGSGSGSIHEVSFAVGVKGSKGDIFSSNEEYTTNCEGTGKPFISRLHRSKAQSRKTFHFRKSRIEQKPQTKSAPASVNVSEVQSPTSVSNQPVSTPQSISSVYTLKPPNSSQAACEMSCEEDSLLSQTTSSTSGYRENCSLLMMQLESPREIQHCYPSSSNSTLVPPVSPESFESDDNIRSSQHSVLMVYGSQDKNTML
ncbi:protein unc-80 homolog isoform X3 [Planococcus citri]|uniref:protein unc-80 homolog isoform X3 n=1 Tax=Planococcus citri TaxID=170843 RepID=UPI0031F80CE8